MIYILSNFCESDILKFALYSAETATGDSHSKRYQPLVNIGNVMLTFIVDWSEQTLAKTGVSKRGEQCTNYLSHTTNSKYVWKSWLSWCRGTWWKFLRPKLANSIEFRQRRFTKYTWVKLAACPGLIGTVNLLSCPTCLRSCHRYVWCLIWAALPCTHIQPNEGPLPAGHKIMLMSRRRSFTNYLG